MIERRKLVKILDEKSRDEIQEILLDIYDKSGRSLQSSLFHEFYYAEVFKKMTHEEITEEISRFVILSVDGKYFDHDWDWSSKTYDTITPLTRKWYDEAGAWVRVACETVISGKRKKALFYFDMLDSIFKQLRQGEIIISHKSVGTEHIYCEYDWERLYRELRHEFK